MSKNYVLAAVMLCASVYGISARELSMDVADVLGRVADCNADVKSARSDFDAAAQGIEVAKSARLPQVSAQLDLNFLGDGTLTDRDFSDAMRVKLPHFGNTLNLTLYQPVYQGGAIQAGIDLARQRQELAAIGIEQAIDASGIEAVVSYFNLMKMRNLRKVYEDNIDITLRLIEQMTEHYNQGTALRNDITRYELRLSSLTRVRDKDSQLCDITIRHELSGAQSLVA